MHSPLFNNSVLFGLQFQKAVGFGIQQAGHNALLVDILDALGRNTQGNPSVFFGNIKLLGLQIGIELATGLDVGMRNAVSANHLFSCYFTNFRHDCNCFKFTAFQSRAATVPPKWSAKVALFFLISKCSTTFMFLFSICCFSVTFKSPLYYESYGKLLSTEWKQEL